MTPKECAEAWKTVVTIYDETIKENNPKITMDKILDTIGLDSAMEVFATVSAIKKHDGRIYGHNRTVMNAIEINPESTIWSHENPMTFSNLDHIHTAHINNLITELIKHTER